MQPNFFIASKSIEIDSSTENLNLIFKNDSFSFFSNKEKFEQYGDISIYCDGYFLPRLELFEEYSHLKGAALIYALFSKYGSAFLSKIKGFFLVVICTRDNFYIYNDIHSVKRFFYHKNHNQFAISDDLNFLGKVLNCNIDNSIAIHQALFQHCLFGNTILSGIKYSEYASFCTLIENTLTIKKYWNALALTETKHDMPIEEFIVRFNVSVGHYIKYYSPSNVAITLTGGRDTRSVLASLIANKVLPHAFTFGNPGNRDVIVGKMLADTCGLTFSNPYLKNPDRNIYKKLTDEIINNANPFIHIHRAHRLDAIKKESEENKIDMLFIGAMGGDYIKGSSFDNYIVTDFISRFFFEKNTKLHDIIDNTLDKNFVVQNYNALKTIVEIMQENAIFNERTFTARKDLLIVHDIIGCTHDIQDINIFSRNVNYVVAPFMDIDVLESLFQTRYSLLTNSKNSKNLFTRFLGGELQAKLITALCPKIGNIPFANYYNPYDASGSKIKYIYKRCLAFIKQKYFKNVPGFAYDKWFEVHVNHELEELDGSVKTMYIIEKLKDEMNQKKHLDNEGYWHKFTNPIMLSNYIKLLKN